MATGVWTEIFASVRFYRRRNRNLYIQDGQVCIHRDLEMAPNTDIIIFGDGELLVL